MAVRARNPARLGDWLDRTPGNQYQAETDGFVMIFTTTQNGGVSIMTDDIASPATVVRNNDAGTAWAGIAALVKRGHYWLATTTTAATLWWIPLEP